jgi:hypothetical protein
MSSVRKQLIVPTAINLLTAINENIRIAFMSKKDTQLSIPSLFKRARIMYDEKGVLPVQVVSEYTDPYFTK